MEMPGMCDHVKVVDKGSAFHGCEGIVCDTRGRTLEYSFDTVVNLTDFQGNRRTMSFRLTELEVIH